MRVAGAKLPIVINWKRARVWIDNGSPISIFTIGEPRKMLGATGVTLLIRKTKPIKTLKMPRKLSQFKNFLG